jgi:hypothetical protein
MTRTGPQTGAHTGPQTAVTRTGPQTSAQSARPGGPPTGPQTASQNGAHTGPQPSVPVPRNPRSAWFQRNVPATTAPDGNGNGGGKGGGNGNGGGNGGGLAGNGTGATEPASSMTWGTAAEDGWSAVRRKLGETAQQQKVSDALPRRRPGSHLVPGSVGPTVPAGAPNGTDPEQAPPQRAADQMRSRLSGYQEGLAKARNEPPKTSNGQPPGED